MNVRECAGLAMIIVGAATFPLGWMISHKILIVSYLSFGMGCYLFFTGRVFKRAEMLERESEGSSNNRGGATVPLDIHNYMGWRTGGRTETFESTFSDDSVDGE